MITLYRTTNCPRCGLIEDALGELAIACEVVTGSADELAAGLASGGAEPMPPNTRPPVLVDDGQVFQGSDAILEHLEELENFKELWYKYQSDACYCGEEDY